ncbi:MAG: sugar transferase [Acidimicrobiales bacterium]|jgi:lipopolysaccharide/colanic/teichoic acid biosynthesis glycosyltransferase|nr:sugar transferase [Acidimicrobiales bacterium]
MTTTGLLLAVDRPAISDRATRIRRASKRLLDLTIASLALVVLAPLLAVAAGAVLVLEGRPVFFRQVRVGRHERPFTMLKFRTMVPDAERRLGELRDRNERSGPLFKVHDDPRVTPIGRLLRLTSIDELPQLLHVVSGRMSLVGPRPALPEEVAQFDAAHRARHELRPGITGCWQAAANEHASFERYRALDLYYLDHWGPALDLRLLAATAVQLLRRLLHVTHARLTAGLPAPPVDDPGRPPAEDHHDATAAVTTAPVDATHPHETGSRPGPAGARTTSVLVDLTGAHTPDDDPADELGLPCAS